MSGLVVLSGLELGRGDQEDSLPAIGEIAILGTELGELIPEATEVGPFASCIAVVRIPDVEQVGEALLEVTDEGQ